MIPGLDLKADEEQRIQAAFEHWSDHFKRDLESGGVAWLVAEYASVVTSLETRSCHHGPGGSLRTGNDWQQCCGISYEYANDITVRDAIQVLYDVAPSEAARAMDAAVKSLDVRLHAMYEPQPERTGRWWRQGLPACVLE